MIILKSYIKIFYSRTSKDILSTLKGNTEKAANLHLDMSQSLAEQAQRIQAVRDKFSQQCKQADDVVKRLQANKRDSLNKTQAVSDMLFELLSLVGG